MPTRDEQLATLAVTPSSTDIAIASEVILETIGEGYMGTGALFAPVAKRLADEPVPDSWTELADVEEAEVRRVRSDATTITALAELEACGALLPVGRHDYYHGTWTLNYKTDRGSGGYSAESGNFNFAIAGGYRPPSYKSRSRLIDSPRVFIEHTPAAMGAKVRRVMEEAVNAYRFRQYFAVAVLLGVASEAAWGQLARSLLQSRPNAKLQQLLANPRASAADIQEKVMQTVRSMGINGVDLDAIELTAQTYRELRNYAVHRPDEHFDEMRVARPKVGVLLEASVDYFGRLYELRERFR